MAGARPLEILLGPQLFELSGEGLVEPMNLLQMDQEVLQASPTSRQSLSSRLPSILELVRYGGRLSTKRLVKAGVGAEIVNAIKDAEAEWQAKSEVRGLDGYPMELTARVERDDWVKDKERNNCQLCNVGFTLINRKHHCRMCGALVCASCTSKKLTFAAPPSSTTSGKSKEDRACDGCFNYWSFRVESGNLEKVNSNNSKASVKDSPNARAKKEAEDRAALGLDKDRQSPQAGRNNRKGESLRTHA